MCGEAANLFNILCRSIGKGCVIFAFSDSNLRQNPFPAPAIPKSFPKNLYGKSHGITQYRLRIIEVFDKQMVCF